MAKKKARRVSVAQLRSAVDKAAKAATSVPLQASFQARPGIIYGRMLRAEAKLNDARAVAQKITNSVAGAAKQAGISKPAPAVLIDKKGILVGFVGPLTARR